MRSLIVMVVSVLSVTGFVMQADAIEIKANSATIFYDNFESYSVGTFSSTPAPVGNWLINVGGAQTPANAAETNIQPSTTLPGGEGAQYLNQFRNLGQNIANAQFSATPSAGDALHAEMLLNLTAGGGLDAGFGTGNNAAIEIYNFGPGNTAVVYGNTGSGDGVINTGLSFTPGAWEKWTLDWVIGAPTATIGVAGNTFTYNVASTAISVVPTAFTIFGGSTVNVDAVPVPEPCAFVLSLFGCVMALVHHRRTKVKLLTKG